MSVEQRLITALDATELPDGLTLTKADIANGYAVEFPRASYPVQITKAEYHPQTNSLILDSSPWLFYTKNPTATADSYVRVSYPVLQDGVDIDEIVQHFAGDTVDVVSATKNSDDIFEIVLDASAWWRAEGWSRLSPPYFPLWSSIKTEVIADGVTLACSIPKTNDLSYERLVLAVTAGETVDIPKSGNECFFISLDGELTSGDKTFEQDTFYKLTSPSISVTASDTTLILKVFR